MIHSLTYYQTNTEWQIFDRKSVRIACKDFAELIVAFANADGGEAVIGIENDGTITGVDDRMDHLNELLRVPYDFCIPSVPVIRSEMVECVDKDGKPNHVVVMQIAPSLKVYTNQADEVFYRVGDKSKKLNFDQRLQLVYAKGGRYFEDAPVNDATMADIDNSLVAQYCEQIGYEKTADQFLEENGYICHNENYKGESVAVPSGAAVLLFGKNPQNFFQRAQVRVIRFEGDDERVGREMNVIKDVIFTGSVLELTNKVKNFVSTQIKEHTYLGQDGLFRTDVQYPEFCWTELIVNAICHRDYSILGTDIQVKLFDTHMIVESPGILPGLVRTDNIRNMHFSRNPKIAQYMRAFKLVKEFGEGVDRMYREMQEAGSPEPQFELVGFMVKASIYQHAAQPETRDNVQKQGINNEKQGITRDKITQLQGVAQKTRGNLLQIYEYMLSHPYVKNKEIATLVSVSDDRARVLLMTLVKNKLVSYQGENKERVYFLSPSI